MWYTYNGEVETWSSRDSDGWRVRVQRKFHGISRRVERQLTTQCAEINQSQDPSDAAMTHHQPPPPTSSTTWPLHSIDDKLTVESCIHSFIHHHSRMWSSTCIKKKKN